MSTSLALKFRLDSGDTRTFSFSEVKEGITESDCSAAMEQVVVSGDTFVDPPIEPLSAILTTTEKTVLFDNE